MCNEVFDRMSVEFESDNRINYSFANLNDSLIVLNCTNGNIIIGDVSNITNAPFDNKLETDFNISPNPATDFINIETESLTEEIEIYNMLGIPVLKTIGSSQIDVSGLSRGVYYVKIDENTYSKLILH
jgi:hypothetical protein